MPISKNELNLILKSSMPDAKIHIEDMRGDENHYHATIKSSKFKNLNRIQQHQLVYKALGNKMGTTLHALKLTTLKE